MSATSQQFAVDADPISDIESGTSILLTGDDSATLASVFAKLVAAGEDEQSVILETERSGGAIRRTLNQTTMGAGSRSSILACEGRESDDGITVVDDPADLTGMGMQLSSLVTTSQQSVERFRTGIYLCSTICDEAEDARSVYRFLNSNFLTELRRGEGIGVCAFDTDTDLETDVNSMLTGMETSFTARIDVEKTGFKEAQLTVSGLSAVGETVDISL
ncbi:hypothetical protein [Natrialba sp. SSL1]|uniref:hypothetical protein n=1 Tax=Natrialba sp. SSL1 TaxID=1869245 RepID=UPI0008F81698|nr:hypothetical protein [Natrialba sp. SSL1]OIB57584.1 hypothetical protein BBD46_12350 [Natrialba sp. SSL1]